MSTNKLHLEKKKKSKSVLPLTICFFSFIVATPPSTPIFSRATPTTNSQPPPRPPYHFWKFFFMLFPLNPQLLKNKHGRAKSFFSWKEGEGTGTCRLCLTHFLGVLVVGVGEMETNPKNKHENINVALIGKREQAHCWDASVWGNA